MKIVGIAADNYKLEKFKAELDKKGFQYEVKPFTKGVSIIKVSTPEVRIPEIKRICEMVEHLFKKSTQN